MRRSFYMIQKWFALTYRAFILTVLLAALVCAGCVNPLDPPEQEASGLGTVQLRLVNQSPRTLLPNQGPALSYTIQAQKGSDTQTIDDTWNGASAKPVTLAAGTWIITVTGYVTEGGTQEAISRGSAEVEITAGGTATAAISLSRLETADQGTGTFIYGGLIVSGFNLCDLRSAALTLQSAVKTAVVTRDLQSGYTADSAMTVDAGYYILTVRLTKPDSTRAAKSEVVHIYQDRTTKIGDSGVMDFGTGDFTANPFTSLDDLAAWLQSQPDNTAAAPYQAALIVDLSSLKTCSGSSVDALGTLFNALNGKYVSIDLSGCTGTAIENTQYYAIDQRQNKDKLVEVILPAGITSIGDSAFWDCTSLALTSLPAGITSIGDSAFYGCENLALTSLPASLTSIGNYAFAGCESLALTSLPASLTSIGDNAFNNCENLALTSLPASLTFIGDSAFSWCTNLVSVTFESGSAISSGNFGSSAFPEGSYGSGGDSLRTAYLAGGAGTYTREANGSVWTKQ
jgi:hypothetical protein